MQGTILTVSRDERHRFSKTPQMWITLVAGMGVEGDAHAGPTVRHRSRVARDPTQPNLRQVHLLQAELLDELAAAGFTIGPGHIGENVLTRGVDLLGLSTGTRLRLGQAALVEVTGLRNPCVQLDRFQPGLMAATLGRDAAGGLVRKAGVMAIVLQGGDVHAGDEVTLDRPPGPHRPLPAV
jgi:MOSC domain-containing protein YiiM